MTVKIFFLMALVSTVTTVRADKKPVAVEFAVKDVTGSVTVNGKRSTGKIHLPADVVTGEKASVQILRDLFVIELRGHASLAITEDSESPGAFSIELKQGEIAIANPSDVEFTFLSPVAETKTAVGAATFRYAKPELDVSVAQGQFTLSGLGAVGESVEVLAREKAFLRARLEGDEIVFDTLLDGKKVIRADLSQTIPLSLAEVKAITIKLPKKKKMTDAEASAPKPPSFICKKPAGKFNDCLWRCDRNRTVRERCDANGTWSDQHVISSDCQSIGKKKAANIAACDY